MAMLVVLDVYWCVLSLPLSLLVCGDDGDGDGADDDEV